MIMYINKSRSLISRERMYIIWPSVPKLLQEHRFEKGSDTTQEGYQRDSPNEKKRKFHHTTYRSQDCGWRTLLGEGYVSCKQKERTTVYIVHISCTKRSLYIPVQIVNRSVHIVHIPKITKQAESLSDQSTHPTNRSSPLDSTSKEENDTPSSPKRRNQIPA